jgi:Holliday junction DNA helicase RuvA
VIASLRGTVLSVREGVCVLDVAGVGYAIHVTPALASQLESGLEYRLDTSMIVREDAITLYGFDSAEAKELFEICLGVTGVGPRSALAILSLLSPAQVLSAVLAEDDTVFRQVPGIGPKTAKLITVQLAGRLHSLTASVEPLPASAGASPQAPTTTDSVVQALVGLGWPERAAREAVESVGESAQQDAPGALLRQALALLARGGN